MALKRRDVAIAAVAAFVAWSYLVSWFPVVRWAGYAFVTGILLTVLAIAATVLLTAQRPVHESSQLPRASFLRTSRWKTEVSALKRRQKYEKQSLEFGQSQQVAKAVDGLLDLILRDFVRSWYSHISPNPVFPNEIDRAVRSVIASLLELLRDKDLADIVTSRLIPILTAHIRDFYDAEKAIRGRKLNRSVTESEELDLAIASKYKDGRLHAAASLSSPDTKMVQQDYLRSLVERLMPKLLPENMLASRSVSTIIREIVSCAVLSPVFQLLSDPDTWNQAMENYGRTMLQDRSTVRKLRAALDQHALPIPQTASMKLAPRLFPGDSERKFEKFIRGVRQVNNLSDARRIRSEVASQLKRDCLQENQDPIYLRRLEMGKRILDQKVQQLAAGGDRQPIPFDTNPIPTTTTSRLENATLVELLKDSSGLSYFMEYMERQRLMSLVQFWLVVDGFRNPLEDDGLEDEHHAFTLPMWSEPDRLDLQQIHQAYLSKPELHVPESSKREVRRFLEAGKSATSLQYYNARKAILKAQSAVLEEMQSQHYHGFKKSDLYYKCLASQESSIVATATASAPIPSTHAYAPRAAQSFPSKPRPVSRLATSATSQITRRTGSAVDLRGHDKDVGPFINHRRSMDETVSTPSPSLDEYDAGNEGLVDSVHSIDQEQAPRMPPDTKIVEAVEEALNNIMDDERPQTAAALRASLFGDADVGDADTSLLDGNDRSSNQDSLDSSRPVTSAKDLEKPSLSSLGLVSPASRIGVFVDDDLFQDEDKGPTDERDDDAGVSSVEKDDEDEVHEAAPGDLGLAEAITALSNDIDRLSAQEAIIDSLTRKAELTNNTSELRILRKSKASLQREIRRKELQRQQYVVQESDNSLYGRSTIKIKSIQVGREEDGREFAMYVVEVQRNAGEQMPAASWIVTRRYSEFHDLHQKLRSRYASVRSLDFPRRRVVMKFQSEFLRKRREALEKYLRELLFLPDVCRSRDLRAFLSQSAIIPGQDLVDREDKKDLVSRLYDSVADGMDDILGNIPVLDQISVAGQNLIAAATNQLNAMPLNVDVDEFPAAEAEAELNAFENKELEPFIKPICDIFLEVFELNRGNNWLRGRAVVVVLQQLLGGTIERKVRDNVKGLLQDESLLRYIGMLQDSMWPNGILQRDKKPRSAAQKKKTRTEASLMLATLVPDLAGSVVGRVNAQAASRRIFATLNNSRLNAHLVFTMVDEIISVIFDDV